MIAGQIDSAMVGGGRTFLTEGRMGDEGGEGDRTEGTDLVQRARHAGYRCARNSATAEALHLDGTVPVPVPMKHRSSAHESDREVADEPSPAETTRMGIDCLSTDENDFRLRLRLRIEAGRVDRASHVGNAFRAMTGGVAFADTVAMAGATAGDSLPIVTADHEHSFAISGYCGRGSPINGLCCDIASVGTVRSGDPVAGDQGKVHLVVGDLNGHRSMLAEQPLDPADDAPGPGETDVGAAVSGAPAVPVFSGSRPDLTDEEVMNLDDLQQAPISKFSESHPPEDVASYAKGPFAHLFDRTIEQNVIVQGGTPSTKIKPRTRATMPGAGGPPEVRPIQAHSSPRGGLTSERFRRCRPRARPFPAV